jgi:hypothetical protein
MQLVQVSYLKEMPRRQKQVIWWVGASITESAMLSIRPMWLRENTLSLFPRLDENSDHLKELCRYASFAADNTVPTYGGTVPV